MATSYDNYFAARGVTPDSYKKFTLPGCLLNILPDKSGSILDIGCGYGQMLKAFRESGFTSLKGVDLSSPAVAQATADGLDVVLISDLRTYLRQSKVRYDLVIMSHVIEHIEKSEIIETLELIRSGLLSPTGALYIGTPNAQSTTDCYWAYEDFTHTTIFTAGSLLFVLRRAGYTEVTFLDPANLEGLSMPKRLIKQSLQACYRAQRHFWNKIMGGSYHRPSPELYTWELRVRAR